MPILVLKDKRWTFDLGEFTNKEAMAIEKATGYSWQDWTDKADEGDVLATTGLVWMVRRRAGEDVAFSDVDFAMGDISFELDAEQKRAVEEAAAAIAAAEAVGEENPTQSGEANGGNGPEASPRPAKSTGSPRRSTSGSNRGSTTS